MRRIVSLSVIGAVLSLGLATTVQAAAPTTQVIPAVEFDDPFLCEGDPVVHVSYTAPFRLVTYVDNDGNVTRDATFGPRARLVLTDEATGRTLTSLSPAVFRTTYDAAGSIESITVNGLNAAITVPGQGVILLDTGTIAWQGGFLGPTLVESGPHGWFGSGDRAALCAYFRA